MTDLHVSTDPLATLPVDAVVVGIAKGEDGPELVGGSEGIDAALGGRLAAVLSGLGATGKANEVTRLATLGATTAPTLVAVGLGPVGERFESETLRRATGAATRALAGTHAVATTLAQANGTPGRAELRAVGEGALLGAYSFDEFRSSLEGRRRPVADVTLVVPDEVLADAEQSATAAGAVAASVTLARDLVNTPPLDLYPARLAEVAAEHATAAGLQVEVLDEQQLRDGGYGGISGVGQGSTRPPRLVKVSWSPEGATRSVALVGKGITFDSGGLSLKPSTSMETMKSDMAGAAAVLGAVLAAARLELPVAVTGWLPLAENMPSGAAIRPSDVLTMYGGTRVEVLNTDAEGRLVLGDALARAAEDSPDVIVDVATLTGAQVVALGTRTSGVMANDDDLRSRVVAAGDTAGEAMWAMPLPPELRATLDSSVADLSNVPGSERNAGMLVAGVFLQEFVPEGTAWAHIDIAGPSWNGGEAYGYTPKGATGVAVRTLLQLVQDEAARVT